MKCGIIILLESNIGPSSSSSPKTSPGLQLKVSRSSHQAVGWQPESRVTVWWHCVASKDEGMESVWQEGGREAGWGEEKKETGGWDDGKDWRKQIVTCWDGVRTVDGWNVAVLCESASDQFSRGNCPDTWDVEPARCNRWTEQLLCDSWNVQTEARRGEHVVFSAFLFPFLSSSSCKCVSSSRRPLSAGDRRRLLCTSTVITQPKPHRLRQRQEMKKA